MLTGLHLWQFVISILVVLSLLVRGEEKMVADKDDENDVRSSKNIFNFASQAAGAVVLDKSPSTAKGYSHLLNDDMDKYGISACDEKKWVVIGLSEDILVTSIALANYEKYSSMLKEFQLLASTSYPTEKWINLGVYEAQPRLGMQTFNVSDSSVHTRYLKVKFNTHHGTEDLCTLSQIKVHGTTVIASFKQEVERSDQHMRDLISHLNGDGVIAVADIQSSDEVNTNATEAAISATGKVKGALGGEDRNQTQLVLTEGAQESSPASAVLPRNSLSAVSTGDGEEAKPNAPSDQRPIENNITDSTVEIRPQTSDGNVSIQNAIEAGAAQNSTSSNSSLLDVEASEESKNSLGVSHGIGTTLGTRAEEAVSKEHSPRHVPNGTNSASVAQSLTVPAGSVPSSISVSADPVAIAAVIPSSVESNGTEPVLSMTEVADSLSGRAADSGKSATNTSSDAAETVAENSETSKENTTIAIPKTEITPKSAQSTVTPISAVDNSSSPVRAENVSTKLTDLLPTSAETRVDTCNTTKTVADESVTVSDAAHKTRTASGELEILNTTVAPTNATACRSVTDRDKHALLSGNITEKDAGSVNSTVPDAVTDLALSRVSAHEAVPRGTNGTSSSSSNARETSKEPNPLLKENTATNATGTSDLNSTVSNAEIAVTADSALGPVVERETDNETRARPDMIRKESGHADALGDVSDVSKLAALPHVLLAAASEKYETLLAGGEDKEREWDKDDKISSLEAASLSGYGTLAHGSQGSTPGMLSPLAAAPLAAALLDSPVLPLLTTPGLPRGMNGPTVGFSPLCLETLRFTEFQAMMANKLKQRAESDKTQLPLHSQDNVFRQLMMKIKTLEMNYAIIEMYSAQVSECYRSALHEIYANMSQSHVHSKKVNSDALGHTKSTTGDVGLSDILLGSQEDEFLVPEGEGVLKVLISGMGSTASLAAVDVDDDDSLCPRVNTRNCTSTPISQPSVGSCVGGKLNLLSSGILGVSLGASQGPVPLSVCSLKNGCASIEDLSSLSPLLPRQLFLSEEDSEKEQLEGLSASSPDSVVSCSEIDKSGDGQYIEILHSENVSVPDGTLRSHEMDAEKQKHEGLNDSSAQGQASRLPSMGLTEDEIMLVLGISLAVSSISLALSVVLCVAFCCVSRSNKKTVR